MSGNNDTGRSSASGFWSFGARAHDVADSVPPGELAARAAALGVPRLQLALMKSYPEVARRLSIGLGEQFRVAFAQHGVSIAIFSCYLNLIHPDAKQRQSIINTFSDYLRHASAFGARMVVSETGSVLPEMGFSVDNHQPTAYAQIVDTVRQLCAVAAQHGVLVGIEPGLNHPIYNLETTKRLITDVASPNLAIVLDPFNLLRTEQAGGDASTDPANYLDLLARAFSEFGDVIEAVQLKDCVLDPDGGTPNGVKSVPVGTGILPIKEAVAFINQQKPGIDIILEDTPAEYIPAALRAMTNG